MSKRTPCDAAKLFIYDAGIRAQMMAILRGAGGKCFKEL